MASGRLYAVICEVAEVTRALLTQLQASHRTIHIVCNTPPQTLLEGYSQRQLKFAEAVASKDIRLYHRAQAGGKPLDEAKQLIKELKYFAKARGDLVVIENATAVLGVGDIDNAGRFVRIWRRFLQEQQNTVLMCLGGIEGNPILLNNLRQIQDELAGLAICIAADGKTRWDVQHWYTTTGIGAGQTFDLQFDEQRILEAHAEQVQTQQQAHGHSVDIESVWTVQAVVKNEEVPQSWSVSAHIGQLVEDCGSAVSGTLVLPYTNQTVMKELARLVFELRKNHGRQIKILVREISARMRHAEERLLRHLGASFVVPMEIGFSRLLGIVESVKDLEFEGNLSDDFEQAFIMANPERKLGYLAPADFISHVHELIVQAQSYGIKFAFVKLNVYRAMSVREVLKICQIRRPGDICSADKQHVYLFLFGCRESDISKALQFIFNLPIAQLFNSEERNSNVDEALLALETFEQEAAKGRLTDHTGWLAKNRIDSQDTPGPGATVFDYRQSNDVNAAPPIGPAMPKPLKLKTPEQNP